MDLIFVTNARYVRTPDNKVFSLQSSFSYHLYKRYLEFFDRVFIIARVKQGDYSEVIEKNLVNQDKVQVFDLPYFVGLNEYLKVRSAIKQTMKTVLKDIVSDNTVVILRIPGRIGTIAIDHLKKMGVPYGLEIIGDPFDVMSPGAMRHPLRPLIRIISYFSLKRTTRDAPAALYVTQQKLQERYPCHNFSVGVSDVVMPESAFRKDKKQLFGSQPVKLISVGSLEQLYKAPDVVMKSIKILKDRKVNCHLTWVGDGIYRDEVEDLVKKYGISSMVTFTGQLSSGDAVRAELDESDIFLMPSRQEGLPRAMVEAMARRLPVIGSNIGGIPELLDERLLVPPNKPEAVADKVALLIANPEFAHEQSTRNFNKSKEFAEDKLGNKREEFYRYLISLYKEQPAGITHG